MGSKYEYLTPLIVLKNSNVNHSEIALHSQAEEIYLETLVLCGRQQQTHVWLVEKQND